MEKMNPKVLQQCGFGRNGIQVKVKNSPDRLKELLKEGLITDEEYAKLSQQAATDGPPIAAEPEVKAEEPAEAKDVTSMDRKELMATCRERGIKISPSDKNIDLIAKLS